MPLFRPLEPYHRYVKRSTLLVRPGDDPLHRRTSLRDLASLVIGWCWTAAKSSSPHHRDPIISGSVKGGRRGKSVEGRAALHWWMSWSFITTSSANKNKDDCPTGLSDASPVARKPAIDFLIRLHCYNKFRLQQDPQLAFLILSTRRIGWRILSPLPSKDGGEAFVYACLCVSPVRFFVRSKKGLSFLKKETACGCGPCTSWGSFLVSAVGRSTFRCMTSPHLIPLAMTASTPLQYLVTCNIRKPI